LTPPDLKRRRAGVCAHLTSLPGPHGIGEIGRAAFSFMDWMQERGLSVWQFLPTGPTGYGNSPYQPISIYAGNPLLIDLRTLFEWGLLRPDELTEYPKLAEAAVEFGAVIEAKLPLLTLAARRFPRLADPGLVAEYEAFCARNDEDWLDDFAAFVLLKARHAQVAWPDWSPEFRQYRRDLPLDVAAESPEEFEQIKLTQFFFARQWADLHAEATRRGIVLFGDVPIYMALDCAEAWSDPSLLELDERGWPLEVAGVPPDYFSADGQLWGNPVYRWETHAADGYRWWISRLRHALARADLVRLDHFRGFEAYWAVPAGAASAREGSWKPGPGNALFDALQAAFGTVPIVAEDLGVITEAVIALRKAYALPGMQVLQFLVDQMDFDTQIIGEDCVCYTGTHDNDTSAGWFAGTDGRLGPDALAQFRSIVAENVDGAVDSIHKALISLCFQTSARLAIAPLQDFLGLGSEARLNTPGQPKGNWRWRVTEAGLAAVEAVDFRELAVRTGRA
jgi:4-alpha-glucanotransferase